MVGAVFASLMVFLGAGRSFAGRPPNAEPSEQAVTSSGCADSKASVHLTDPNSYDSNGVERENAEEHYERGLKLSSAGDQTGAEEEFRLALAEEPGNRRNVKQLADLYIGEKQYHKAIGVIRDYTKLCGATALGYALEGELLFQQKQYDSAQSAIAASLALADNDARMHELMGLIWVIKEKNDAALMELEKAEKLAPDSAQTRYFYGRMLYVTGRMYEARDQFLACLKIQPHYRKALENLGLCYEVLGDYSEATEAFQKAIALEKQLPGPKHGEPFAYYGKILVKQGKSEVALPILREGLALSPRSFAVNYEMGQVLLALGDLQQSEHFLEIAKTLDPDFSRTYFLLGKVHQKQHRIDEAAQDWAKFQQLNKIDANRIFPLTDR